MSTTTLNPQATNGGIAAARRALTRITAQHQAIEWLSRENPGRPHNGAAEVLREIGWGTTIHDRDEAREAIEQEARSGVLSVEWRSGWSTEDTATREDAAEWRILLSWGGPAVQVLCAWDAPTVIQGQDWFTAWEPIEDTTEEEVAALEWFATTTTGIDW